MLLDKKVKHELYYSSSADDVNKVFICNLAKEIWDTLVVTFEGT